MITNEHILKKYKNNKELTNLEINNTTAINWAGNFARTTEICMRNNEKVVSAINLPTNNTRNKFINTLIDVLIDLSIP